MWVHWCVVLGVTLVVTTVQSDQTSGVAVNTTESLKRTDESQNTEKVLKVPIKPRRNRGKSSSGNSSVVKMKVDTEKMHKKGETNSTNLKVKLNNGSYLLRKASSLNTPVRVAAPRIARGGGYSATRKSKGYKYKKPGYVYTTPKPRLPPLAETEEDNDSQSLSPPEEDPQGVNPEKGFVTNPPPRFDAFDIRDSVPGEPGKDYMVHATIPETNFTCEGRTPGFYADPETGCQVFHRCHDDPWYTGQVRVTMDSFLCPNGSLFNQQILSCDWWSNVDCPVAHEFYQLNEQIGQLEETEAGIQYVQFGGVRVPPPPGHKQNAPKIIPKSQRQPLPEQYRTKGGYDNEGNPIPDRNGSQGLSVNKEDPENLANKFLENDDGRGFSEFSAAPDNKGDDDPDQDRNGSSQNVEEVSARPPKSKKSKRKGNKKSKTTTTTTPPPEEEEEDDEEADETAEDEDDTEEESAATNNDNASGFIINRRPGQKDQVSAQGTPPKEVLEPPNFTGDPVDSEKERSSEEGTEVTYIPPSTEGPTYIPPTTEEQPKSGGYSYPAPQQYLPPSQDAYLPPKHSSPHTYMSPPTQPTGGYSNTPESFYSAPAAPAKLNDSYLPPQKDYGGPQQHNAYLPLTKQNSSYLPPQQQKPSNAYLPPQQQNNAYLPPQQPNAYLPPQQQNNAYLPPEQQNNYLPPQQQNNAYLPPQQQNQQQNNYLPPQQQNQQQNNYLPPQQQQNNAYLPPQQQQNNAYLPPQQQQNNAYLPPQQQNNAYIPPQQQQNNAYLPPQQQNNAYIPPQQQQNNAYLPPQQQNNAYMPPQQQQNNAYLPPQQQNNANMPPQQQQNNVYLPPQQQQNNVYLPPQQQNSAYIPPQQQQNNAYLPPQQQNNAYIPPQQQTYIPPQQQQNNAYIPPQQQNNAYIPPPKPNLMYLPPQKENNSPTTAQQQNNAYVPPKQLTNTNLLSKVDNFRANNYISKSQFSIELVKVPLVSYSHSQTPGR